MRLSLASLRFPALRRNSTSTLAMAVVLFVALSAVVVSPSPSVAAQIAGPDLARVSATGPYGSNLLTNPGAESGLAGWTIIAGGWAANSLCPHSGSNHFDTSLSLAKKSQEIDLLARGFIASELDQAPSVSILLYYRQHEYPDNLYLKVQLRDASHNAIATYDSGTITTSDPYEPNCRPWHTLGATMTGYGAGLRYIYWEDWGKDTEGWGGYYGVIMDDATLTLAAPPTPTATATATGMPTHTATRTPTRTATRTRTRTSTPSRTAAPSMTPTPTETPTPAETATITPTPSITPTLGPSPTPTRTPIRSTRTAGVISIAAETFTDAGAGQTRAAGSVLLNNTIYLSGVRDHVLFSDASMTGSGTVVMAQGQLALFTGSFMINTATGILTPGTGISYNLNKVAGFTISGPPTISQINVPQGTVTGSADLSVSMPGVSGEASATFTINPGPIYAGQVTALDLSVAGVKLSAPINGVLANTGLTASGVTLTGSAQFGSKTAAVTAPLTITPSTIALGSGARLPFPDLCYGGLTTVQFTGNQALLKHEAAGYYWDFSSTLNITLPAISKTIALGSVTLRSSGLSGNAGDISLTVAALTLQLNNVTIGSTALTPQSATLSLPGGLGGDVVALSNVSITQNGLVITGEVSLPDIEFEGSESSESFVAHLASIMPLGARPQADPPLKLTDNKASLTVEANSYVFSVKSKAELKLPDNEQSIDLTFTISASGGSYKLEGTLSSLKLKLAGSELEMKNMALNNSGFGAESATLTLPESLGSTSITVDDISITSSGLSVGGGSITFPTIKIGDGSKLQIKEPTASIKAKDGHYTFGVKGTLQLRLAQNDQDIAVDFTIGTDGQFTTTIDKLSLTVASTNLKMTNLTFNNSGLSVGQATLTLPEAMGGASGFVNDVKITKDGLSIGGGGATFPFPDFSLGSETTGFKVTKASGSLEIAADKTFKFTLSGTVAITVPGGSATATGSIGVNSQGQLSGSLSGFSLTVAGLSLDVSDAAISNSGAITIGSATLKTPEGFGGLSISVYNVTITKSGGVSIGGGAFTLPAIKAGGFEISASGKLVKLANPPGYEISASGTFKMSQIGSASGCSGISVNVTLFASASGSTIMLLRPEGEATPQAEVDALRNPLAVAPAGWPTAERVSAAAQTAVEAQHIGDGADTETMTAAKIDRGLLAYAEMRHVPDPQDFVDDPSLTPQLSGLKLKNASLSLTCQIPIGTTGLFLTSIRGSITLAEGTTTISVGMTVSAGKKVAGTSIVSFDADATLTTSPFKIVIEGTVKVFVFSVGGAHAEIDSAGFKSTLWMTISYLGLPVGRGTVSVNAWSSNGFHMTGTATLTLGWQKGDIWHSCVLPYPCNWKCKWYGCWPRSTCYTCINVPPTDMYITAGAQVGEFTNGAWGFKGYVSLLGYRAGFYIDSVGRFKIGNVDGYRLVTRSQVLLAKQQWQTAKLRGEMVSDTWSTVDGDFVFPDAATVLVPVPVSRTTDIALSLVRSGDAPALTIVRPNGNEITPGNLPANITYQTVSTYTTAIRPGATSAMMDTVTLDALAAASTSESCADSLAAFRGAMVTALNKEKAIIEAAGNDQEAQARVSLTHAWPGVGAVDLLAGGSRILTNTAFGATTAYAGLAPGVYAMQVVATGTSAPVLAQATVTATVASDYTLVGAGNQSNRKLLVLDDAREFSSDGSALFRLVNASPDAPAVDLYIDGGRGDARRTGDAAYVAGLPTSSASDYEGVAAGTYNIELRLAGTQTVIGTLSSVALNENSIYTIYALGLRSGTPAFQTVLHLDAERSPYVRFAHAMAGLGAVDVYLNDTVVFTSSAALSTTSYAALQPGTYSVKVLPAGALGPTLATGSVTLAVATDDTLLASGTSGNVQLTLLPDDDTVPEWGMARLRLVHASPNAPAVDVSIDGTTRFFTNVAYRGSSAYRGLGTGAHTVQVYRSGTTTLLMTGAITLGEGEAATLFLAGLSGGNPALQMVLSQDLSGEQSIQEMYIVQGAQTGVWQMKLTGEPGPLDTYLVSAIGSNPAPGVSDVAAVAGSANQAQVGWRITSDEPATLVSVYANPGAITSTVVVTDTGAPITTTVTNYSGELIKTNIVTPLDGRVYTTTVSLNQLASGSYHIWVEADDGKNPPARAYALNPLLVNQSGGWPATWTASATITPTYGALDLSWAAHPHPDVDGYTIHVGTSPLSLTDVITLSDGLHWTLESLDPGQMYYLKLGAYDQATGKSSLSQVLNARTGVASFTLTAAPETITVIGGQQATTVVTVSTSMASYPDAVGLYQSRGDGVRLLPSVGVVTPTIGGVAVPVVVSTTNSTAGGLYTLLLLAGGGGMSATVNVPVMVQQPGFDLGLAPNGRTLGRGQSVQVVVTTGSVLGDNRPVSLALSGVPKGLQWRFSSAKVNPGVNATLTLSDTSLLAPGVYPVVVTGDNGVQTVTRTLTVTVQKVSFDVTAQPAAAVLQPGERRTLLLNVHGLAGWSGPVTLVVQAATIPAHMTVGFVVDSTTVNQVTVAAPGQATLHIITDSLLPRQTYVLRLTTQSGDEEHVIEITVNANPNVIFLPEIMKAYTATQ